MAVGKQYVRPRRTRGRCVLEFLVVAAVACVVGLAIVVGVVYLVINTTHPLIVAAAVICIGGGLFLVFWLWVTDHWDGEPWRDLANAGRAGQEMKVDASDKLSLHVEVEGPETALATVVFCHGIAMNASAWRYQRGALAGTDVRRVSYDARGHGKSGRRKLDQGIRGVRQLADDLGRVIDATAPAGRLVLVGHSLGSLTLLALAPVRPDLVERIGGFVMCAPSAGPLRKTMTFGLWWPRETGLIRLMAFGLTGRFIRREFAGFLMVLDALPRFVTRVLGLMPYLLCLRYLAVHRRNSKTALRPTVAIVYDNGFRQSGDLVLAMQDHDERPGLANLGSAHVVVIEGRKDRIIPPSDQDDVANGIPGAALTAIPKCGHQTVFEDAEIVTAELIRIIDLVIEEANQLGDSDSAEQYPHPQGESGGIINSLTGMVLSSAEQIGAAGPIRDGLHSLQRAFRESPTGSDPRYEQPR